METDMGVFLAYTWRVQDLTPTALDNSYLANTHKGGGVAQECVKYTECRTKGCVHFEMRK